MKTLINMTCLILWMQPHCLGTYCGNVWKIRSIEKLMLCTYYLCWQLLCLTIPFGEGSVSVQVSAEWMCQQLWWHPQWSFCCAAEHMILSSENKCFCNVGARCYFLYLPSYLKSLHLKNQIFWGKHFSDYLPLTAMALSFTQSGKKNNPWEIFLQAVPAYREESSQLAHLPLQE